MLGEALGGRTGAPRPDEVAAWLARDAKCIDELLGKDGDVEEKGVGSVALASLEKNVEHSLQTFATELSEAGDIELVHADSVLLSCQRSATESVVRPNGQPFAHFAGWLNGQEVEQPFG